MGASLIVMFPVNCTVFPMYICCTACLLLHLKTLPYAYFTCSLYCVNDTCIYYYNIHSIHRSNPIVQTCPVCYLRKKERGDLGQSGRRGIHRHPALSITAHKKLAVCNLAMPLACRCWPKFAYAYHITLPPCTCIHYQYHMLYTLLSIPNASQLLPSKA